jgi:hypothetical protein
MMAKNLQERENELVQEIEAGHAKRNEVEAKTRADAEALRDDIVGYLATKQNGNATIWIGEDDKSVTIRIGEKGFTVTAVGDDHWKLARGDANKDEMQKAVLKFLYSAFEWPEGIAQE